MGDSTYEPKSIDAMFSRIEARLDQFGDKFDKLETYIIKQHEKTEKLEIQAAEAKAAAKTAIKMAAGISGLIAVGDTIIHWLSAKK